MADQRKAVMAGLDYDRIEILQPFELGVKFIEWSLDSNSRPADGDVNGEFKDQMSAILKFPLPSHIKKVMIIQCPLDTLLLRLPPKELVEDTTTHLPPAGDYPLPDFYAERLVEHKHQDNQEFFRFRIGDYTIALCV
jgi:hypothetical protein